MKSRFSFSAALFWILFFGIVSRSFAAPVELEGLVAGVAPTNTGSEVSTVSENEEKEFFNKQEAAKEQVQQDIKEKEQLTKNLNYLLIQAYKGKIDKIFWNLQDNIAQYPAEIQINIFKKVSDSVTAKMKVIEEKWASIGANRKEVLWGIFEYIRSLVNTNIARVESEK